MKREITSGAALDAVAEDWSPAGSADTTEHGFHVDSVDSLPGMLEFGDSEADFVVEGLMHAGTVNMWTSDAGDGKTTLALYLAFTVSRGLLFAGRPTSKRKVLILDRENPRTSMIEKCQRLNVRDGDGLIVWGGWHRDEPPDPDCGFIQEWIVANDPKPLIVLDSLVAFHRGDENNATETRAFLHRLRKLAALGCTILNLAHAGKAATAVQYRGSSDIAAAIDLGIRIRNSSAVPGRLDRLTLTPFKNRQGVFSETVLQYADGGFRETPNGVVTNTDKLIALLKDNPHLTKERFSSMAMGLGLGRNRARNFLASYGRTGHIQTIGGENNSQCFVWRGVPTPDV